MSLYAPRQRSLKPHLLSSVPAGHNLPDVLSVVGIQGAHIEPIRSLVDENRITSSRTGRQIADQLDSLGGRLPPPELPTMREILGSEIEPAIEGGQARGLGRTLPRAEIGQEPRLLWIDPGGPRLVPQVGSLEGAEREPSLQ